MDWIAILERFGLGVAIAIAMGIFIHRNQIFLQNTLMEELDQDFKRLEGIIIKLIDQQKLMQIKLEAVTAKYNALVKIITQLMKKER